MPKKPNLLYKQALRLIPWVCLAAFIFIFSGCSGAFKDNEILNSMKEHQSAVDLNTGIDMAPAENGSDDDFPEVETKYKRLFEEFIARAQKTRVFTYNRVYDTTKERPQPTTKAEEILFSQNLATVEAEGKYFVTNKAENKRLFYDGEIAYEINLETNTSEPIEFIPNEKRHFISYLVNETALELVMVDEETVGESKFTAYHVIEDGRPTKWYFDGAENLAIRIFKEQDILCAVRYNDLKLNPPIEDDLINLKTAENEISPNFFGEETPKEESENIPQTTELSGIQPTGVTPGNATAVTPPEPEKTDNDKIKPDKPTEQPKTPQTTEGGAKPQDKPGVQAPKKDECETTAETSREDSFQVGIIADLSEKEKPKDKKPVKEESNELVNYPHSTLPIMVGMEITSVSDKITRGRRVIEITGTPPVTLEGAADYYDSILKNDSNAYDYKQMYDEKTGGTYYIVKGRKDGWNIRIDLKEDHVTLKRTINMYLEK